MPKIWAGTIDAHRKQVRQAILQTTAELVRREGLAAATMSRIAAETGVGRATLYKYFDSVEAILATWQREELGHHLDRLREVRAGEQDAAGALEAVLRAHAAHARHRADTSLLLAHVDAVHTAHRAVHRLVGEVIREAATAGAIRTDVPPAELATYCMHALGAAHEHRSRAATERLVDTILTGLGARGASYPPPSSLLASAA